MYGAAEIVEHSSSFFTSTPLPDRAPWHGDENAALHVLDQRDGLVHGFRPPLDPPRLLPPNLALFQVCKLPQVMHRVEVSDLDEPGSDSFHDLASGLEATAPMCLPLEKVTGVEGVRSEFKHTAEAARRGGGPEGELLHQGRVLADDEGLEVVVECGELRVA